MILLLSASTVTYAVLEVDEADAVAELIPSSDGSCNTIWSLLV